MRVSIEKVPVDEYAEPPLAVKAPPLGAVESATGSKLVDAQRPALLVALMDCEPFVVAVAV